MTGWTAADIVDLSGRTMVVTGANSGIGFHTALELARHGAHVIAACRDEARGKLAVEQMRAAAPGASIDLASLDLADLASVRRFSDDLLTAHPHLDVLVNNAGVMAIPQRTTADGFEMQVGTNHLGHFALTGQLLPALLAVPDARVVTVSSSVAHAGRLRLDDVPVPRRYGAWTAYARSKLANLLFLQELARRASRHSSSLISTGAHPGYADTNLQSVGPQMTSRSVLASLTKVSNRVFGQPAAAGALPSLYAAVGPLVASGSYFGPHLLGMHGSPVPASQPRRANDQTLAAGLWERSEELTGVSFDWG